MINKFLQIILTFFADQHNQCWNSVSSSFTSLFYVSYIIVLDHLLHHLVSYINSLLFQRTDNEEANNWKDLLFLFMIEF